MEPEAFDTVLAFTEQKEKELKDAMYAGEVKAAPYELGGTTACDYCACRDICGFDQRISGDEYRRLERYTMEEAVEKMKERLGAAEDRQAERMENSRKGGGADGSEVDGRTAESDQLKR